MPCNFFLMARHAVLGKRNGCREALVTGEGAFHNPVIRFQFSRESLPLYWELHQYFQSLPPFLQGERTAS